MKRNSAILPIVLFIIGAIFFLYPSISRMILGSQMYEVTNDYEETIEAMSPTQVEEEWQKAVLYNEELAMGSVKDPFSDVKGKKPFTRYFETLKFDYGMGYIEIPSIKCRLPIYHTVSDEVLSKGVGHIPATALPVGGIGTHAVLTGHSGIPHAELFEKLQDVKIDDYIIIHVLGKKLAYQVGDIREVLPDEMETLKVKEDKDLITLVTCVPIGINSHRLLVSGERAEVPKNIKSVDGVSSRMLVFIAILLIVVIIILINLFNYFAKRIKENSEYKK